MTSFGAALLFQDRASLFLGTTKTSPGTHEPFFCCFPLWYSPMFSRVLTGILILYRVPSGYSSMFSPSTNDLSFFSVVFHLGTHPCFPPVLTISHFSLFSTYTGASEKYVPAFSPGDQIGYSGRTLPNAWRQARGVFTASVLDRYHSHFSIFGLPWPLFSFIFQYSAVLHWLEPTSAYLEVSYADAG